MIVEFTGEKYYGFGRRFADLIEYRYQSSSSDARHKKGPENGAFPGKSYQKIISLNLPAL